uniref:Uncharacterized protein n=1 Tax=Oryza punctata TaxID=4537 RepID=A0A0E0MD52_ORYPU
MELTAAAAAGHRGGDPCHWRTPRDHPSPAASGYYDLVFARLVVPVVSFFKKGAPPRPQLHTSPPWSPRRFKHRHTAVAVVVAALPAPFAIADASSSSSCFIGSLGGLLVAKELVELDDQLILFLREVTSFEVRSQEGTRASPRSTEKKRRQGKWMEIGEGEGLCMWSMEKPGVPMAHEAFLGREGKPREGKGREEMAEGSRQQQQVAAGGVIIMVC